MQSFSHKSAKAPSSRRLKSNRARPKCAPDGLCSFGEQVLFQWPIRFERELALFWVLA